MNGTKKISPDKTEKLLSILKTRFEKNMSRHKGLDWAALEEKLKRNPSKLWSPSEMERTGGEPDIIEFDKRTDEYIYVDCSTQTPVGRRNTCYDREGLESRKTHKPENNAIDMAESMGIEILTENQYRNLQRLENFDTKTSSWLKTSSEIRNLGGAIFGDRRYDHVFIYHNSASSYYAVRGFRGVLRV
ncbi:MAG: DUF4256 domain-containing protein [Fibrobacter sp.]|nr:DUF4256 domain-containing protein [Fibrobacter sp.]